MRVLVTGANGMVGQMLCTVLEQAGHQVVRAVRQSTTADETAIGDVHERTPWGEVLSSGIDAVVHLAGKTSVTNGAAQTDIVELHRVNALGTAHLGDQCVKHGVKRFLFVSSVKVLGEGSDRPYRADDPANPGDDYAASKWEAEQSLWAVARDSGMEVSVVRPPLIYGPGVKENFLRLMQTIDGQRLLPFGAIRNRRSLIYLGNLTDAINVCLTHPMAAGKTYLLSDGEDVSTPELIRRMANALGRKARLLPFPVSGMKMLGKMLGMKAQVDRLIGSLVVDTAPIRQELDWTPPYTMQEGLTRTVGWFRHREPEL